MEKRTSFTTMPDINITAFDGFAGFSAGMQGGIDPLFIPETAYHKAINVSGRGWVAQTRPGFVHKATLAPGVFQGASRWSLDDLELIVVVVGNAVYAYESLSGALVYALPGAFTAPLMRAFFTQVSRWMVIQNGLESPVILQESGGIVSLYGRTSPEVCYVPGSVGAYAHGRYHYVPTILPLLTPAVVPGAYDVTPDLSTVPGLTAFVSSDVLDTLNPEYVFRMSEHRVLALGGALAMPEELGYINAMATIRNAATGSGVGELILFGREGVCAFSVSVARSQWQSSGISQVLFTGAGTRSPFAVASVNRDLIYVDSVGAVRRMGYDYNQFSGGSALSNTPISGEMSPFTQLGDPAVLPYTSATFCNNRFLWLLNGQAGPYFSGIGVMDTTHLYALQANAATFDGAWTGFDFLQVLTAKENGQYVSYIVAKDTDGTGNHLFALSETAVYDYADIPIEAQLYTRFMGYATDKGPVPNDLKVLQGVDIWLNNIKTPVALEVLYRPSHSPVWTLLGTKTINVPGGGPQARRRLSISLDKRTTNCDPVSNEKLCVGNSFQFLLRWKGFCRIDKFRTSAALVTEEASNNCGVDNPAGIGYTGTEGELVDDFSYVVPL